MRRYTLTLPAFTLIELIVAVSIFAIIMVSVLSIFLFSSQMSTRVELNRSMQENVKNVVEDITENIRKWWVDWVRNFGWECRNLDGESSLSSDGLCLRWWNEYVVGSYNKINDSWDRVSNSEQACSDINSECRILKRELEGDYFPLTNSFIHFEFVEFTLSNEKLPKLSINFTVRPSFKKWIPLQMVRNNTLQIQTTVSERLIKTN